VSALERFEAQVMALAGLTQGVHLALSVARQGQAEPQALAASLGSVLQLSADSPEAIYGGLAGVRTGLRLLVDQLRGQQRDADLVRIGATVLSLERRYGRSGDVQGTLRALLQAIADEYGPDRAAEGPAVAALAQAYLATLSTLTPRIRVAGNPLLLKDEANIQAIRACLLAALRSAALWHQLGGRGWRLLLQRGRMVETAQRLLGRSLAAVH
jgi:high frequency lysogenization protein